MNKLKSVIVALVFVAGIGFGYKFWLHRYFFVPQLNSAQLLVSPKALLNVNLEKNKNELFGIKEFKGQWSLIFFGFTSCPDFCPLELQKLGKILQLEQQQNNHSHSPVPLQVIFISLDPERDTPEKIKTYTAFFHPQIQGVSGNNRELVKVAQFFGSDYSRHAVKAGKALSIPAGVDMPMSVENDYQVDHSARIYIVNPHAEYVGSFASPHKAELLWEDLQTIMGR